jgi:hypothetical protein
MVHNGSDVFPITFVDLDGYAITIYDRDAPAEGWSHTG